MHNMSHGRLSFCMAADTADFKKGCMETTRPLMIEAACSQRSRLGRSAMLLADGTRSIHVKDWSDSSRSKKPCTRSKRDRDGLAPLIIAHLHASLSTNQMLLLLLKLGP